MSALYQIFISSCHIWDKERIYEEDIFYGSQQKEKLTRLNEVSVWI